MPNLQYTSKDTNPMSWGEFGKIVEKLTADVQAYSHTQNIIFDTIAPVLRNGAIPGVIIANRLQITSFLPVQVKYDFTLHKPVQLGSLPTQVGDKTQKPLNVLVTDCNLFSGASASLVASILNTAYRTANLYYASVTRVYKKHPVDLSMYKENFCGVMTNENFEADQAKEHTLHLRPKIAIYPWETVEQELQDINAYFA